MATKTENQEEGSIRLRAYRRADLAALVALDRECFAAEFLFPEAEMRGFAEERGAYTVVAERGDGTLVGFGITRMEREGGEPAGYCVTLDVAPGERRTGLGRRLLEAMEGWVLERGGRAMALHVFAGNEGARRLYEANGYTIARREAGFYGAGLDALVCRKELG